MIDYIRNDMNIIIGTVNDTGSSILYTHVKYGAVGSYNKLTRMYNRFKSELGPAVPLNHEDYGRSDVLTLDKIKNKENKKNG